MQSLYKNFHSFIQMNFIVQRIKKYCLTLSLLCAVFSGFIFNIPADNINIAKEVEYMEKILSKVKKEKDDSLGNYQATADCLLLLKAIECYKLEKLSKNEIELLNTAEKKVNEYIKNRWGKYPPYTVKSNLEFKVLAKKPEEVTFGTCGFTTGTNDFVFIPGGHMIQFEPVGINEKNVKEYVTEINKINISRLLLPYEISQKTFTILMNGINVEFLTLYCHAIKDISVLKYSTRMKELNLTILQHMEGFDSLQNLKHLEKMFIDTYDFKFKNLSLLGKITSLKSLHSYSCDLESLAGVENFKNLEELYIYATDKLLNLEPLSKTSKLKNLHLRLGNCKNLKEVSAIAKLQNLRELVLELDDADITPLEKLQNLEKLELYHNECDLSPIGKLHNLRSLSPPYWIKNLDFIKNSKNLEKFKVTWSELNDLSGLANLPKLKKLDLSYSKQIKDYSPIGSLPELQVLFLSAANVENIDFVKDLKNLKVLHLIHNKEIKDFTPLFKLTQLKELIIADCKWFDKDMEKKLQQILPNCDIRFTPLCICEEGERSSSF